MIIGCIGDVHGRACHALAVLARWQAIRGCRFDLIVQVGDLGVLPDSETGERPYDRFSQWDPAVYDLCDMATGGDAKLLREFGEMIACPILVVAGNHDEFSSIPGVGQMEPVPIDPHGLFHYMPDGYTVEIGGVVVGFFEGVDPGASFGDDSDRIDVLVSHEGGFGDQAGNDLSEGPEMIIDYLKSNAPRYHLFGHFHHPVGPIKVHATQCVQVSSVVSNPRDPTQQVIEEGCMVALDTESGDFEFIKGEWLGAYEREGGLRLIADALKDIR